MVNGDVATEDKRVSYQSYVIDDTRFCILPYVNISSHTILVKYLPQIFIHFAVLLCSDIVPVVVVVVTLVAICFIH